MRKMYTGFGSLLNVKSTDDELQWQQWKLQNSETAVISSLITNRWMSILLLPELHFRKKKYFGNTQCLLSYIFAV